VTLLPGRPSRNPRIHGQSLCSLDSKAHDDMQASRGPGGLRAWIRLTNWRVARVDSSLNMASAAIFGGATWHTSNVSDHAMSGGPNNLLLGLLTSTSQLKNSKYFCITLILLIGIIKLL